MPLNNQNKVASMQPSDKAYPDSFPIASGNPDPVAGSIAHLLHLLDRPIAFHRCFVDITGSVTVVRRRVRFDRAARHEWEQPP